MKLSVNRGFVQGNVSSIIPFLLIISVIPLSELLYNFLRYQFIKGILTFTFGMLIFLTSFFVQEPFEALFMVIDSHSPNSSIQPRIYFIFSFRDVRSNHSDDHRH